MIDIDELTHLRALSEEKLNSILALPDKEKTAIAFTLTKVHFPELDSVDFQFTSLVDLYKASWVLEKVYRNNKSIREGFTPIYNLKAGYIVSMSSDMYLFNDNPTTASH